MPGEQLANGLHMLWNSCLLSNISGCPPLRVSFPQGYLVLLHEDAHFDTCQMHTEQCLASSSATIPVCLLSYLGWRRLSAASFSPQHSYHAHSPLHSAWAALIEQHYREKSSSWIMHGISYDIFHFIERGFDIGALRQFLLMFPLPLFLLPLRFSDFVLCLLLALLCLPNSAIPPLFLFGLLLTLS